jgi:CheY-like chemotaxis protein
VNVELRAMTNSQRIRESAVTLLDHAVGEIFLLGIARHVLKGQHRDRRPLRQWQWRRERSLRHCVKADAPHAHRASGEEALAKLADGIRPQLIVILSDINMPGMDGFRARGLLAAPHPSPLDATPLEAWSHICPLAGREWMRHWLLFES